MPLVTGKDVTKKKGLMGFFAHIYIQQCIDCSGYALIIILSNSVANSP